MQHTSPSATIVSLIHSFTNHYNVDTTNRKHNFQIKILLPSNALAVWLRTYINARQAAPIQNLAEFTAQPFPSSWIQNR